MNSRPRLHHRWRFFKGLFIALRILLSYRMAGIFGKFMPAPSRAPYLKRLHQKNAALIREKAIEMKGVMIKVGQFLSSRIDLLPDEYITELSQLQDQVPPHDYAEIRKQLIDSLGSAPEELFSSFSEQPLASASLGQVHEARLRDGRRVAVKIQYPNIDAIIETDIRMFSLLVSLMQGRHGKINLRVLHGEFSKIIRAELDYILEAKNAERFRENFSDDDRIVIPSVIWEHTRNRVLTLEFVEGIKITECSLIRARGIDCRATVNLLAETYSKMIFIHGFFHGDPHPGNIFVAEGPRLVFVDFGMVQDIPSAVKRELRQFAHAIVERNTGRIIESMENMGFIIEGANYEALARAAQYLIDKYRDISPHELKSVTIDDISGDIEQVIGIVDFIQIPNNFILLGRTIGMLNGMAYTLNPDVNMIELGKPFIKKFLKGGPEERIQQFFATAREKLSDLWDLSSELNEFFSKANRGDLSVKLAKAEMEELTGRFRTMTNVMMLVILTVTASAAALFLTLMGNPGTALIAGGISVAFSLLSVLRLMK